MIRPPLISDWIVEWNCYWCYIVITNSEEVRAWRKYSVPCRPRQCHHFDCTKTYPPGGGASRIHGSRIDNTPCVRLVTAQEAAVTVLLVLPYQKWLWNRTVRTIFTARKHNVSPISIYCCSFSLYFLCFMMIFDDFWWSFSNYGVNYLFDIIFFH